MLARSSWFARQQIAPQPHYRKVPKSPEPDQCRSGLNVEQFLWVTTVTAFFLISPCFPSSVQHPSPQKKNKQQANNKHITEAKFSQYQPCHCNSKFGVWPAPLVATPNPIFGSGLRLHPAWWPCQTGGVLCQMGTLCQSRDTFPL